MNWKRRLYYSLGPVTRRIVRRMYYYPADLTDLILGRRDPMIPPRGKIFTGPGDFKKLGQKLMQDMIRVGGLKPNDKVLDIGCEIGRVAIPLTGYLKNGGTYDGFDIVSDGIEWCRKHISSKYPEFKFRHIPLRNDLYNLNTDKKASDFHFPYADKAFDFILLTSVFTHMQTDEVKNYLREIARVMSDNGKCFATFFVIDQASQNFLDNSADPFFAFDYGDYLLHDETVKDANIAYRYTSIEKMCAEAGLKIESFNPGWWAGRDKNTCVDFQDLLILKRA